MDDVCAVILAGGRSRRMGSNKALLDVGGRPMISVLIDQVRPLTDQILISSDDHSSYRFLNFPVVSDQYTECGPLAGFHAAMHWNDCSLYIMLACDLPNLRPPLLSNLISLVKGYDAAIPRTKDGIAHPLCAIYRRTCLPPIEQALKRGTHRVVDPFMKDMLAVRWVGPEEGQYEVTDLANINTPEDLQRLKVLPPDNLP
jgi:molybdenum cofactor guanylyltransferase